MTVNGLLCLYGTLLDPSPSHYDLSAGPTLYSLSLSPVSPSPGYFFSSFSLYPISIFTPSLPLGRADNITNLTNWTRWYTLNWAWNHVNRAVFVAATWVTFIDVWNGKEEINLKVSWKVEGLCRSKWLPQLNCLNSFPGEISKHCFPKYLGRSALSQNTSFPREFDSNIPGLK